MVTVGIKSGALNSPQFMVVGCRANCYVCRAHSLVFLSAQLGFHAPDPSGGFGPVARLGMSAGADTPLSAAASGAERRGSSGRDGAVSPLITNKPQLS